MKKFIVFLLLAYHGLLWAQDLTVIRIGATGSVIETWTTPMSNRLQQLGWNTRLIGFPDCQGAEQWVQDNPTKPVMYMAYIDHFILPSINPNHPRLCAGLTVSENSLVSIGSRVYHNICGIDKDLDALRRQPEALLGTWNHPVQVAIGRAMLKDLGVNARVVEFPSAARMIQSLAAKDIDYVVVSYENIVTAVGGGCFITTAPKHLATRTNKLSISDVVRNPSMPGTGAVPIYVAYNVNLPKLQKDVAQVLNTAPEYTAMWSDSTFRAGIAAGQTPRQQWQEFQDYLAKFKK